MPVMMLADYANYVGLTPRHAYNLIKEGRLKGVYKLRARVTVVNTDEAEILPPVNRERRLTGSVIGRSKPLRGEPGFVEPKLKVKKL